MDRVKKLIGVVTGLFCVLLVAGLCSHCAKIDFIWYNSLNKPAFTPTGGVFTFLVSLTYFSVTGVIARHVAAKKPWPEMPVLALTGFCSVLFAYTFFAKKQIYWGIFFSAALFLSSFAAFILFLAKDYKSAIIYLPTLLFNGFSFVLMFSICLSN